MSRRPAPTVAMVYIVLDFDRYLTTAYVNHKSQKRLEGSLLIPYQRAQASGLRLSGTLYGKVAKFVACIKVDRS